MEIFKEKQMQGLMKGGGTLVQIPRFVGHFGTIEEALRELTYLERDGRFEKTFKNGIEG